ncbi:fumarylacetoacetase-like protein [Dinothrombium tinctorium]|uniref:Fumarylacetoacetase n=1 Tax=Dinothrombium tinctorium TaxID=1965070 RepID=A0A443RIV3_9ACAR|nr:fumarylacetoacetase-like protein [Dinothrombium tinctorium]RWS15173.1 fumarylacetoacetase-like protein [Dinothrombium tinctorium]
MSFISVNPESDFSIHNLPYGIFSTQANPKPRPGVAIGDYILDLSQVSKLFVGPLMRNEAEEVFNQTTLNKLMSLSYEAWHEARQTIQRLLSKHEGVLRDNSELRSTAFVLQRDATMHLPAQIGDYTDFFSSLEHAINGVKLFVDGDKALFPNWKYSPLGYHGRASSIVVSGSPIRRPNGQMRPIDDRPPVFGPCKLMDFEIEMAFFIGNTPNKNGDIVPIDEAHKHIFGMVLMNDWSARDIQKWEWIPLGPFLSKNLGTTISPWVVTMEALEPFKVVNVVQEPKPFPYLYHADNYNFNVNIAAAIKPDNGEASVVARTNLSHLYWTMKQMLAHHTITGCNLNAGDLMATGTISGPTPDSYGSMLELSWNGTKPLTLSDGSERKFLHDGDEVIFTAHSERDGCRVGFGECRGKLIPALAL